MRRRQEFIERLLDRLQHCPAMVLVTYRPEFVPPWAQHANVGLLVAEPARNATRGRSSIPCCRADRACRRRSPTTLSPRATASRFSWRS